MQNKIKNNSKTRKRKNPDLPQVRNPETRKSKPPTNIEKYNTLPNLFKTLIPLTPPYWQNHPNEALVYVDFV